MSIQYFDLRSVPTEGRTELTLNGERVKRSGVKSSRFVFPWRDWVVKVDHWQGPSEVRLWGEINVRRPEDARFFLPIVAWGEVKGNIWHDVLNRPASGVWVAQRNVDMRRLFEEHSGTYWKSGESGTHPVSAWKSGFEELEPIIRRYEIGSIRLGTWGELLIPWNWTLMNGRPVIFDYGWNLHSPMYCDGKCSCTSCRKAS